jgi:hypothetical protein
MAMQLVALPLMATQPWALIFSVKRMVTIQIMQVKAVVKKDIFFMVWFSFNCFK